MNSATSPLDWPATQLDLPFGRLHLRSAGKGPALVFWPSLLLDGSMWRYQALALQECYRVLVIDGPGHGGSLPLRRSFTLAECATAAVAALDRLGIERCTCVGSSWGGMVALQLALSAPERLEGLVIINSSAEAPGWGERLQSRAFVELFRRFGWLPLLQKQALAAFLGPTSERLRPGLARHLADCLAPLDREGAYWAARSILVERTSLLARLGSLRLPVLVVAGGEDRVFAPPHSRRIAAAIPGARLVVVSDGAHLLPLEQPQVIAALLKEFLHRPAVRP